MNSINTLKITEYTSPVKLYAGIL